MCFLALAPKNSGSDRTLELLEAAVKAVEEKKRQSSLEERDWQSHAKPWEECRAGED